MKKIILFLGMIILLSSSVFGILSDHDGEIVSYYPFDTADNVSDRQGNNTDLVGNHSGLVAAIVNEGVDMEFDVANWLQTDGGWVGGATFRTADFWVKPESVPATRFIITIDDPSDGDPFWQVYFASAGNFHIDYRDNLGGLEAVNFGNWDSGAWVHVVLVKYDSYMEMWLNNTLVENNSDGGTGGFQVPLDDFNIGHSGNPQSDMVLDNLVFTTYIYTPADVAESYNNHAGHEFLIQPAVGGAITLNLVNPTNNTLSNNDLYNFTYNISYSISPLTSCSLWSNFSGVWANNQTNTSAIINNSQNNFTDISPVDGTYIWNVNCFNESFWGATNFTLVVDKTNPIAVTNFANDTRFYPNLTGQFNFTDDNLIHSINLTVPTASDIVIFNRSNIGTQTFVLNVSFDLSNFTKGSHFLQLEVSDGGTGKELKERYDFDVGLLKGSVTYNFPDGNSLKTKIDESSIFDKWTSIKETDRYIQIYEPNTPRSSVSFIEESDQPIYIYENEGHHGGLWIVTGKQWKDYVLKDDPNAKLTITQLTRNKVLVNITNIKNNLERLEFNSIGGLNTIKINYTFFAEDITETFNAELSDLIFTNLFLDFNGIGHAAPPNVILEFNGTNYTATQTNNDATLARYLRAVFVNVSLDDTKQQVNVSHRWFFNLTNETITPLQTQLVSFVSIDNCSIFTTIAANFTTKRDDNDELVVSTLNGFFQFELNGTTHNFNISSSKNTSHILCIFPAAASYLIDAQIEYINNSFNTESYYFRNATFNNNTQQIDLLFTPNATLVTFIVKDENDDFVQDVFINILQYDFGTNTHRITEIIKTDSQGEALGSIVLDTQWYKFLLNYKLKTVFESEPIKLILTSRTFRINLLQNFYEQFNTFRGMVADVTFTNSTRNFAYTFNNPTGNSVTGCLKVQEILPGSINLINESCTTASSGTILVNIGSASEVNGRHFIGRGFVQTDTSDATTKFVIDHEDANFIVGFETFGSDGIFISFLARITMALIGIWSPIAAILGLIAIDVAMVWMGLYHMSLGVMIGYIIMAIIVIIKVARK